MLDLKLNCKWYEKFDWLNQLLWIDLFNTIYSFIHETKVWLFDYVFKGLFIFFISLTSSIGERLLDKS